jgi:hypothetical protein
MLKLHVVTLISLLLLMVAVGCSSSDPSPHDKAVSATLTAAFPAGSAGRLDPDDAALHYATSNNSLDDARSLIEVVLMLIRKASLIGDLYTGQSLITLPTLHAY